MIRIMIADDHAVMRLGTKKLLGREVDFEVVGEACDGHEVKRLLQSVACDVILLDMDMPKSSGVDLIKDLKALYPRLAVLVFSMHSVEQLGIRSVRAGASGYLSKNGEPELIAKAIRIAASGRKYVSEELAQLLADETDMNHPQSLLKLLSDREYTVVRLIATGQTVSQIAELLSLSVKTVSNYRTNALEKMNMQTNADIMSHFYKNGLL